MKSGSPSSSSIRGFETTPKMGPSAMITRTGTLMKLGDGLMNRGWNHRHFLLRGSTLQYFTTARDSRPREVIDLLHAEVVWLGDYMDRSNCIYVEPLSHRPLHLSGITLEESKQWMRWFQEAADPQAYHDLPPVNMQSAVRAGLAPSEVGGTPFISPSFVMPTHVGKPSLLSPVKVPTDLSPHCTEPAHILERVVNSLEAGNKPHSSSDELNLVDVVDGMRVFVSSSKTDSDPVPKTLLTYSALVLLLLISLPKSMLIISITLVSLYYGYSQIFSPQRKRTTPQSNPLNQASFCIASTVVDITNRGCLNWVTDASKFTLWDPSVAEAFSNPSSSDRQSSQDYLHIVFRRTVKSQENFHRFSWITSDQTACVVTSSTTSPGTFEAWCIRPRTISSCRVWFLSSFGPERVVGTLSGINQISHQFGDHDGTGIPKFNLLPDSACWSRHWRGGLYPTNTACFVNGEKVWSKLVSSSIFGERKISVSNVFPRSSDRTPLQAIASLFVGLINIDTHQHNPQSVLRSIFSNFLNGFVASATFLGSTNWKMNPKQNESLLCWLGSSETSKAPQVFLEVIETSRPAQGLFATIKMSISGHNWTLKGTVKYSVIFHETKKSGALAVMLSNSPDLKIEVVGPVGQTIIYSLNLPNLVMAVPNDNRIFWEGVVRVSEDDATSIVARIEESGDMYGSVLDSAGHKVANVEGHWLENLSIDNEVIWTLGGSLIPGTVMLKRGEDLSKSPPASPKSTSPKKTGTREFGGGSFKLPRLSSADEEVVQFIESLRRELPELEKDTTRFTNEYLYRFSKARHFDMKETVKMLEAHIEWLEENDVANIAAFEYGELPQVRVAFPHGYHGVDKLGRPIYVQRLGRTSPESLFQVTNWDRFIKFWIQSYEDLVWKKVPACKAAGAVNPALPGLPPPSALASIQTVTIVDLKGVGLGHFTAKAREFLAVTSKISSNNYPEILGSMYVVNTPGIFPMIWNQVKSILDPGTRAKIHLINSKQTREKLLEVIDADQLPCFLGGDCKCDANAGGDDTDYGCLSSDRGPWKKL